jgi:homoserine dehydrogenase
MPGRAPAPAARAATFGLPMTEIKIALLGLGTVGSGVIKVLQSHAAEMEERAGCRLVLHKVADADLARPREGLDLRRLPMVADANTVLDDPAVQIVIELVGGLEPARTFILKALQAGKHVVTANKALLAHHGAELFEEARRNRVALAFEAAVAGGIPLIRAVKDGLPANRILSAFGIVNGTCNYILTRMTDEGRDFAETLKEAQERGYAEADPTLDIEGLDSAHKLQILATLAFRTSVDLKDIYTEGITAVSQQDVVNARELGYRIKLLAIAKTADGELELRVHPTMIPADSPMAAVSGVFNAVFITGDNVGNLMFYGRGAGQLPTASAVWSDTLEIARRVAHGIPAMDVDLPSVSPRPLGLRPMEDIRSAYYLRVTAMDKPGVLAQVAGILGAHDISLISVLQKGRAHGEAVPVVMMTHEARERDMRAALAAIDKLPVVASRTAMIRVEVGS